MAVYIVEGGVPLRGTIQVHGAKNAALPVLAAALLPPESRIEGCPRLSDTAAAMNILRSLGCQVQQHPDGTAEVDARPAQGWEIPEPCMREMRSSIIFLGAILTRFGRARVSFPGGCELGPRPIDLHLAALERMGAVIREDHGTLDCTVPMGRLHGAEIVLNFPSVGATQNILIAAVLAEGRTVLHGAAREPEIEDLIRFLNGAGATGGGGGRRSPCGAASGDPRPHRRRHLSVLCGGSRRQHHGGGLYTCPSDGGASATGAGGLPVPHPGRHGVHYRSGATGLVGLDPYPALSRFSHRCPGAADGGSSPGGGNHCLYRDHFREPVPPCERIGPTGGQDPH